MPPRCLALVAALAACGHARPPAPRPAAPPPTCERVADHLVSLMSAARKATDEQMDPIRNVITHHCEQDLWTPAVQQCLLAAATVQDGARCEDLLTPAQEDALATEFRRPAGQK